MRQFKSTGFFRAVFSISFVILLFTNVNAQSRLTIEAVEEALDPPKTKGSALYNHRLSERRADAVVEFLVNQGVKRERLTAIGKGFSDLLEPDHPTAAKNHRVRVLTIRESN